MTIRVEWFCNLCNASAQRRSPGDEVNTGYAATSSEDLPRGWFELEGGGHGCGRCETSIERKRLIQLAERHPVLARLADELPTGAKTDTGWPSRSSPFDDGVATSAEGVGHEDGGGVHADGE